MQRRVIVPRPDRARRLSGRAFGWLDARLVRDGWLGALSPAATAVYVFLCVVADRDGVSFYRRDRIARAVGLDDVETARALARLRELDLVAFAPFRPHTVDGFHQVLAVPPGGPPVSPLLAALGLRPR